MTAQAHPATRRLFDLDIQNLNFEQAIQQLSDSAVAQSPAKLVVTVNVDHIIKLASDPLLQAEYASADFIFADGMPVVWSSRLFKHPLPCRVTGADLFVGLCCHAQQSGQSVAVIGGMPGDESILQPLYQKVFPGLKVHLFCPSMQFAAGSPEGDAIVEWLREIRPDYMFICLGFPKQEALGVRLLQLESGLILCVGAAQDFALGRRIRAPRWMQHSGLEWLWRLITQPKKLWRRYLVDAPRFFPILFREWKNQKAASRDVKNAR